MLRVHTGHRVGSLLWYIANAALKHDIVIRLKKKIQPGTVSATSLRSFASPSSPPGQPAHAAGGFRDAKGLSQRLWPFPRGSRCLWDQAGGGGDIQPRVTTSQCQRRAVGGHGAGRPTQLFREQWSGRRACFGCQPCQGLTMNSVNHATCLLCLGVAGVGRRGGINLAIRINP